MFVPVLFDIAFPHTHIYIYINPPMDDKKGTGVKKWNHAERNMSVLVKKKEKKSFGLSSHMTSLPQRELSEGFENVNFLKNA